MYRIEFSPSAERQLKSLPREVQVRLKARIDALAEDSRPRGAERLSGAEEYYRIRAGDYRVIYAIEGRDLIVLVVRVGHRRDVYRRVFR